MTLSSVFDFFKQLDDPGKSFFREHLNTDKDNPLDLYSAYTTYLERKLSAYLSDVNPLAILIFYQSLEKPGFELETLEDYEVAELNEALAVLRRFALVYSRKSVQKVKPMTKVFPYQEVREIIQKKFKLYTFKDIQRKIGYVKGISILTRYGDMTPGMFFYFFSYGLICRKDFLIQQFGEASLDYFLEEGAITEALLLDKRGSDHIELLACYELQPSRLSKEEFNPIRSIAYHTRIFNDIIKLIYLITKDDILITRRGEINKKHYDKLSREIQSENILWFLIQFFTKYKFVDVDKKNNYIYLTERGQFFFRQDIKEVYEKIIESDEYLKEVLSIIQNLGVQDFGAADVILSFLQKNIEGDPDIFLLRETRRTILKYIEILNYMGVLVQKFTAEGFTAYSFNARYKNLINDVQAPTRPLVISPSLEVTVYPGELDLQTSYVLNIFMEVDHFSDIFVYRITPQSVKRALYFEFDVKTLLDTLDKRSRNGVPENVRANILRWKEQFLTAKIKECVLLEGPREVLDRLEHDSGYSHLIQKRLNENTAIVSKEIYMSRIMEEISVYLYS